MNQQNLNSILSAFVQITAIVAATIIAVVKGDGYAQDVLITLLTVAGGMSAVQIAGHFSSAISDLRAMTFARLAAKVGAPVEGQS